MKHKYDVITLSCGCKDYIRPEYRDEYPHSVERTKLCKEATRRFLEIMSEPAKPLPGRVLPIS